MWQDEEGRDPSTLCPPPTPKKELCKVYPRLQWFTSTVHWLLGIFGNTIHQTMEPTSMVIGIAEDAKWQQLHNYVAACSLQLYNPPNGRWAH